MSNKTKYQNQIQKHYDKLVSLGYNVVGVFLYGSQNYELDNSNSDVDSKAIVLPTLNEIVCNRHPISTTVQMEDGGVCDVKDIRKMFVCFRKQNINFIEVLFTQYYVLSPVYKDLYMPMLNNAELIARYNNYATVDCINGMAFEKLKQINKTNVVFKDESQEAAFISKQLHHILRMKDFIKRYCEGEEYKTILVPNNKDLLLNIKSNCDYTRDEAKGIAEDTCNWIKEYRSNYIGSNLRMINRDVESLMNDVKTNLITLSIKNEISNTF